MVEQFSTYLLTERRLSEHTVVAYVKDVKQFLSFVDIAHEKELNEVNHQLVRAWIVHLVENGDSNRTVNRKLSTLRTFFKWSQVNCGVEKNPMLKIKGPKIQKKLPNFVKEEEINNEAIESLFPDSFSGMRDQLLIEILYQTGMRLSELIGLTPASIQNDAIRVVGKGNKERLIPITNDLLELINQYLDSATYRAFDATHLLVLDNGKKMYPKFVYRKVKFYLSLLSNLEKRSPHVLRHTFATHMLNNGAGLEVLKEILGHANLSATQVYTHNSFEHIAAIYKKAHPRGE